MARPAERWMVSDGLSEPVDGNPAPGIGVELVVPSAPDGEDWADALARAVAEIIAGSHGFADLLAEMRVLTVEVTSSFGVGPLLPQRWSNDVGSVGIALGLPIVGLPHSMGAEEASVRLVGVTLLLPGELAWSLTRPDARLVLQDRLVEANATQNALDRESVVAAAT